MAIGRGRTATGRSQTASLLRRTSVLCIWGKNAPFPASSKVESPHVAPAWTRVSLSAGISVPRLYLFQTRVCVFLHYPRQTPVSLPNWHDPPPAASRPPHGDRGKTADPAARRPARLWFRAGTAPEGRAGIGIAGSSVPCGSAGSIGDSRGSGRWRGAAGAWESAVPPRRLASERPREAQGG